MKKIFPFTLVLSFCLVGSYLNAQYFTLRLAGGYAWPGFQNTEGIMGPVIDPFHPDIDALAPLANIQDQDTAHGKPASYKAVHGSYGKGMNFTLGLGYAINQYFGVELGISYLQSATISSVETKQLTIDNGIGYSAIPYYLTATTTTNAIGVSISPSIIVKAPIKKSKFLPFARAGISLPVAGGLTDHISIDVPEGPGLANLLLKSPYFLGTPHTQVTLKTEGTVSIGFNGAVGVIYSPLPFLSISLEVNAQHLITKAKSSKITQWDVDSVSNGQTYVVSKLDARGVYRTQFNFVDELNNKSNNTAYNSNTDLTKPKDDIRPSGPFNNVGINIGVTFNFSKKIFAKKDKKDPESK